MTDTNPTRRRHAENKHAFTEVFGDPYDADASEGYYNLSKRQSYNRPVEATIGEGRATLNPARPSQLDFFCDVENVLRDVIETNTLLNLFHAVYIVGRIDENLLSQAQRSRLEMRIGQMLRARRIVPVGEYFKTQRHGHKG